MSSAPAHDSQIDGVRAFAVGAVLYAHFAVWETLAGHLGVRLFFVLSGFLITRILLDVRDADAFSPRAALGAFYARRSLRIFPAYFLLLLLSFGTGAAEDRYTWPYFATYLSNFLFAERGVWTPWVLGHTWTLSIEEQFYAVWPLLMFFIPRHRLAALCVTAIVISLLFRFYWPVTLHPNLARDLLPPASLDALAIGSLLAVRRARGRWLPGRKTQGAVVAATALFLLAWMTPVAAPEAEWIRWVALEVLLLPAFVLLINAAVEGIGGLAGRVLDFSPIRFLGRISYGIYLYHFLVLWALMEVGGDVPGLAEQGPVRFVLGSIATVTAATLSWYLLENPCNRLKRHFPYRRQVLRAIRHSPVLPGDAARPGSGGA